MRVRIKEHFRKNGSYVKGHYRDGHIPGAFANLPPGIKGWIGLCILSCFTPLIVIALPILIILFIIYLFEKSSESKKQKCPICDAPCNILDFMGFRDCFCTRCKWHQRICEICNSDKYRLRGNKQDHHHSEWVCSNCGHTHKI